MSHFGRSGPPDITDTYSLLVLNITFRTTADDLYPLFHKYGKVVDIFIPRDRRTGDSRGFAFVRYKYADEAQKAVERLDGTVVDGREITVQFAKYGPNAERMPNFTHFTSISPFSPRHTPSIFASTSFFSLRASAPPIYRRSNFLPYSASGNDNDSVRGETGGGDDGGRDGGDVESKLLAGEAEDDATLSGDVIVLDVGGMTCNGCSASVKRILESQGGGQNLSADVKHVIDQLERHCLAPDGSLVSKPAHYDLQLAREEMSRERLRYLEATAIYCETIAMVEEYQQAVSMANLGGVRDVQALYPQLGLKNSPQVYETLEHRMVVAEASQRLRLPLISKDGEIHEEEIEKLSVVSRSSLDSTSSSFTISSSANSTNYASANSTGSIVNNNLLVSSTDTTEPGVGGVPNRFLGITPAFLWQTQLHQTPSMDMNEYQMALSREIDARLKTKCDKVADAFVMDDNESSSGHHSSSARLSERVKSIIEEIEREEAALRQELYSADRKFAEYYNVLEQVLGVLIKLVKDLKLQHQHKYDDLQKTWLCKRCETMNAKLSVLEHVLLLETYTQESIPALHKIRKYLVETTEEASISYNKAVTRLREYQGVDPHFDTIARQYHDIVMKLENMQWTIHQVEMDLKRFPDQSST